MWLGGYYFHVRESTPPSTFRLPPLHQPPSWGTRVNLGDTSGRERDMGKYGEQKKWGMQVHVYPKFVALEKRQKAPLDYSASQ